MRGRLPALALALLVASCGARGGLDLDPPGDAGTVRGGDASTLRDSGSRPDSGGPPGELCEWSFGDATVVGDVSTALALGGAVHPTLAQAAVYAQTVGEPDLGGVVDFATGLIAETRDDFAGELFTAPEGYLRATPSCRVVAYDFLLGRTGLRFDVPVAAGRCLAQQTVIDRIEIIAITGTTLGGGSVVGPFGAWSADIVFRRESSAVSGRLVRPDLERSIGMGIGEAGNFGAIRIIRGEIESSDTLARSVLGFGLAYDRGNDGVLAMIDHPTEGTRLGRMGFAGPVMLDEVIDLRDLRAPPVGGVVTNENEALIPLADSSVVSIPLDRPRFRYTEPAASGAIDVMEVLLRPGASVGGVVYASIDPATGRHTVTFRPLRCVR